MKQKVFDPHREWITEREGGGDLTVVLRVGQITESIRLWVSNADSLWVGVQWHCCLFLNTHTHTHIFKKGKEVKRSNKQLTLTTYQTAGPQSINRNKNLCQMRRYCIRSEQNLTADRQLKAYVQAVTDCWKDPQLLSSSKQFKSKHHFYPDCSNEMFKLGMKWIKHWGLWIECITPRSESLTRHWDYSYVLCSLVYSMYHYLVWVHLEYNFL